MERKDVGERENENVRERMKDGGNGCGRERMRDGGKGNG